MFYLRLQHSWSALSGFTARVHKQETRNLTLHEAQPSAVLNFEFLVRERVLVNPIMHEQRVLKTF